MQVYYLSFTHYRISISNIDCTKPLFGDIMDIHQVFHGINMISELIAPTNNIEVARTLEVNRLKSWKDSVVDTLWQTEEILLAGSDQEQPFNDINSYIEHLFDLYSQEAAIKYDPEYPPETFYNTEWSVDFDHFKDRTLVAMMRHAQRSYSSLLLYYPDQEQIEYNRQRGIWQNELYCKYDSYGESSPEVAEHRRNIPKLATDLKRLQSLTSHLEQNQYLLSATNFLSKFKKYGSGASFDVPILAWGNARPVVDIDRCDFLVHATDSYSEVIASNTVGKFLDGRLLSTSISRVAMDRSHAALFHAESILKAGIPLIRVDEARDAKALREVISWPLPLEAAIVLPTKIFPDRHNTMNNQNNPNGTYYGEGLIRGLLKQK